MLSHQKKGTCENCTQSEQAERVSRKLLSQGPHDFFFLWSFLFWGTWTKIHQDTLCLYPLWSKLVNDLSTQVPTIVKHLVADISEDVVCQTTAQ